MKNDLLDGDVLIFGQVCFGFDGEEQEDFPLGLALAPKLGCRDLLILWLNNLLAFHN